jgi:L-rhamnose-H+ transport protein
MIMGANPLLGVLFHWIGGFASASFYVPYKGIRKWSWEIFWLVGGLFSWVLAPWLFAAIRTNALIQVLSATPVVTLWWCWFWGAMWGLGGLTFGLTMRYLGISLGMAVALGLTTIIGTMGPPIFRGGLGSLAAGSSGRAILAGIAVTLAGILLVAKAGQSKERERASGQGSDTVPEFDFKKGLLVAIFSGIMSSCFAFGLDAGESIRQLTLQAGTGTLAQGLPVLCIVLAGGATTNILWCALLILRNRSAMEFLGSVSPEPGSTVRATIPLARNYLLAAAGGTLWYFQFFFYTMGESQMGAYGFSSWTLHMASIIIFSTLWGFSLGEWRGAATRTRRLVWAGIGTLVLATLIIGLGNYLTS